MPTILRHGPYRFYFFSDEGSEPAHVHVRYGGKDCKFWLNPVSCAQNRGIPVHRLNEIAKIIHQHKAQLINGFHEHRNRQS